MSTTLSTRRVGPFEVSAIGLGCMSLSHAYSPKPSRDEGLAFLRDALDAGVTFLDTATLYGGGANEELVGEALKGRRDEVVLASKCVLAMVDGKKIIDGRPETIRAMCDASLQRLGVDVIDLYYLHRWDKQVPIAESVGAMADLVQAGKIRAIGLSEVSVERLTQAQQVHEIAAVQNEYSLWTRNPELGMLDACRRTGVAMVAFSPLARGVLPGTLRDPSSLPKDDLRPSMPRFSAENYPRNLALVDQFVGMAERVGCTPAQLALAWVLAQGEFVVPIPGTTSIAHLRDDLGALEVRLDQQTLDEVGALINNDTVSGPRYGEASQAEVDAETF